MNKFTLLFHKKGQANTKTQPGYVRYINLVWNDAFADWSLILLTTTIITIILIGIGSYVYVNTETTLNAEGTPLSTNDATHFDIQKLKQVITTFDARAGERVLLSKGYTGPRDPSLP